MAEHDRNDRGATDPWDELEPIDLDALFGDELDGQFEDGGAGRSDDAADDVRDANGDDANGDDADAQLVSRLFAADLADEPASDLSTADILAAARAGADPAGVGADGASSDAGADRADRPAPSDRPDSPDTEDRPDGEPAPRRAVDELAVRRRRRTLVSRSLLAAAAVAVLALGTVAVVNSRGSSDTATATADSGARPAAAESAAGAYSGAVENGPASIQESDPAAAPQSDGSAAAASTSAASAPSSSMESSSGSSAVPDKVVTTGRATGSVTLSSTSGRSDAGNGPVTTALCRIPALSREAVTAAGSVVPTRSPATPFALSLQAASCAGRAVSGQVFSTTDGSRFTVVLTRDSLDSATTDGTFLSAGAVRFAALGNGRLRVLVSTPAASSVTDGQLAQIATTVLATQR